MKLFAKMLLLLIVVLLLSVLLIYFGIPAMLMNVVKQQMEKQAKTLSHYLLNNIKGFSVANYTNDEPEYEKSILHEFEKAKMIGEQSESFPAVFPGSAASLMTASVLDRKRQFHA